MTSSAPSAQTDPVLHWYDLTCPFCYVAQSRDRIMEKAGIPVVQRPYRAHPEVPPEGIHVGERSGAMYTNLEATARREGLPLHWNERLPPSGLANGVTEWVRLHHPDKFEVVQKAFFAAHFAKQQDISQTSTIDEIIRDADIEVEEVQKAIADGTTAKLLESSEADAQKHGIQGTPFWWYKGKKISGMQGAHVFERLVQEETNDEDPYQ